MMLQCFSKCTYQQILLFELILIFDVKNLCDTSEVDTCLPFNYLCDLCFLQYHYMTPMVEDC